MKKITSLLIAMTAAWGVNASLTAPCTLTIDSPEEFAKWTVIDENPNQNTAETTYAFAYNSEGYAKYTHCKTSWEDNANDWLISPAIALEANIQYDITWIASVLSSFTSDTQNFTLTAGLSPDVEGQTEVCKTFTDFAAKNTKTEAPATFTPQTSGDYYFGMHLTSNAAKGDFAIYSLEVKEYVEPPTHPGAVTNLAITAGAEGALESTLTWTWPTNNDAGGDNTTITGATIYRGTSSSSYSHSEIATINIDATPGSEGRYTDNSVPSSGKFYYKVVPFNENGTSTSTASVVQSPFIGPTNKINAVTNLTAEADTDDDKIIHLSWTAPTSGSDGYFDPQKISYTISRNKDGGTYEVIAENHPTTSYTDNSIDGLASYKYKVAATFMGVTGTEAVSNAVITGGTLTLPYSNDFSSPSSISTWTIFHTSGARDWAVSSSSSILTYWGSNAGAWAITPKFALEAGKAYQISFNVKVYKKTSPMGLAVFVGTAPSVEAMTEEVYRETLTNTTAVDKSVVFNVETDGNYCIGFNCFSSTGSDDIFVDDLKIEEIAPAPLGVSEAKAEAAPEGAPEVVLSWTNPTKTNAGTDLTAIDRVVISSGSTEVKVIENAVPGAEETETIPVDAAGEHTFAITAYLNDNASETVEVTSGWVGTDTPKAPESVTVTVDENGERIIEFTPVSEGIHGGYVDTASLLYEITRNDVVLTSEQAESPYVDSEEITELGRYTYAVAARSGETLSDFTAADPVTLGPGLELPYEPVFDSITNFSDWTLAKNWNYDKSKNCLYSMNSDSWAFTPALAMKEGKCKVSFSIASYSSLYPEELVVYLTTEATLPISDDTPVIAETSVNSVDLTSEANKREYTFDVPSSGNYYIVLHQPSNRMFLYLNNFKVEQTLVSTGIEAVEGAEAEADVRFFDLQGRAVAHPRSGQLLIKSVNGHASKIRF